MSNKQALYEAALAAQRNAYAPYSAFMVGASIRTASGRVFAGCNVENSAYPEGMCAEGAAIAAMIAAGEKHIVEVLVIGTGDAVCSPCGGCRQKLSEFAGPDTPVHMCNGDGVSETETMAALMPFAFGAANLSKPKGQS